MPYLQLNVIGPHSAASKKRLAAQMSRTYAEMMSVDIRRISVAIRELGEGGVWRIPEAGGEPVPVSVMMLDIRQGDARPNFGWRSPRRCAPAASRSSG